MNLPNNSDDPMVGFPGYEGEKPGYSYIPGFGYVPISDEPGGLIDPGPDSIMPNDPCIKDENGNCTVHEHSGNV